MQGAPSRYKAKLVPACGQDFAPSKRYSTVELIVIGANGAWGRASTAFVMCWPSHKSAFHCGTPQKEPRIPDCTALAGISTDLMQSQEATDDCRRRPIGLSADAQIRDWRAASVANCTRLRKKYPSAPTMRA